MEIEFTRKKLWYGLLVVILLTSLFINLRISVPEEIVFGDEGYYAARGKYIANNLKIPIYDEIYGERAAYKTYLRKIPFTFFLLSSVYLIGGELLMKALIPIITVISATLIFFFVKKLHSIKAGIFAATFYLVMPAMITQSVMVITESVAVMFTVASIYFLWKYLEAGDKKSLFTSGIMLGFGILAEASIMIFILINVLVIVLYKRKSSWKGIFVTLILTLIIISPWMLIHNYYQTGSPGMKINTLINRIPWIDVDFKSSKVFVKEIPHLAEKGLKGPQEIGKGTTAPLMDYGFLKYIEFAYTLPIFIFSMFGFSYYFIHRKKKHLMIVVWALIFFSSVYFMMRGSRVEDLSRNSLAIIAPLSMTGGLFVGKIYDYFKSFKSVGKIFAILFLVILLGWSFSHASSKAEQLRPVKKFSPAFFEGCGWIKENTPKDSLIYTLWVHRAEYHCERTAIANNARGMQYAILSQNETTYEIFKKHGIDYLYIQKFSIKPGKERVSYPLDFIRYIESSDHYKRIYSYPPRCLYNQKITDCVVVYEIADEVKTEEKEEIPQSLKTPIQGE